jgi:hypothetical protein
MTEGTGLFFVLVRRMAPILLGKANLLKINDFAANETARALDIE